MLKTYRKRHPFHRRSHLEVLNGDLPPVVTISEQKHVLHHHLHVVDDLDDGVEGGNDPAGVGLQSGRLPHRLRAAAAGSQSRKLGLGLRVPVE